MLGLFEEGTKMKIPCNILPHLTTLNGKKLKTMNIISTHLSKDFKLKIGLQAKTWQPSVMCHKKQGELIFFFTKILLQIKMIWEYGVKEAYLCYLMTWN